MLRFLQLLIVFIFFSLQGCKTWVELTCPPDNEPVLVPKKIESIFPSYATTYKVQVEVSKSLLDSLKSGVTVQLEEELDNLREDLDQESATIENFLKAALSAYSSRPCDEETRNNFWKTVDVINDQSIMLRQLKQDLTKQSQDPVGSPTNVRTIIRSFRVDYTFFDGTLK